MKKKLGTIVLCMIMISAMIPTQLWAAETDTITPAADTKADSSYDVPGDANEDPYIIAVEDAMDEGSDVTGNGEDISAPEQENSGNEDAVAQNDDASSETNDSDGITSDNDQPENGSVQDIDGEEILEDETETDPDKPETETEEEKPVIPVNQIQLKTQELVLPTKGTAELKVEITPSDATNKNIIWKSSNEKIATVDKDGKVTALRYGNAVITGTSEDNSKLSVKCSIKTLFYDVNGTNVKGKSGYQYYYDPVYWATGKGIINGYDGVYFAPGKNCSRTEMMIILWRYKGKPQASGSIPFKDVKYDRSSDSYKAVLWGVKNGIIKGYNDNTFRPNSAVSRKDAMIMLYRTAGKPMVSGSVSFKDVVNKKYKKTSDTYKAILWGSNLKVTGGYSNGNFQPGSNCLREHIVTFIYRYNATRSTGYKTGLYKVNGKWRYYENGVFRPSTGVVKRLDNNRWYYVVKGIYNNKKNGFVTRLSDNKKVYVRKGSYDSKVQWTKACELAEKRLKQCGGTIKGAFQWAVDIPFIPNVDGKCATDYAVYTFTHNEGDCRGKAGAFYYMALLLGYEAYMVDGYAHSAGGLEEHGWTEIIKDGKTYVCDISFHQHYSPQGRTGYFVRYGQKGTWRYTNYHRIY